MPGRHHRSHRISHQPQFPKKTVQYLEQHHSAICFLDALKMFIDSLPQRLQHFEPNTNDRFDIYGDLVLCGPQLEHTMPMRSRIRAHPQHSNGTCKRPILAWFDTVLVDVDTKLQQQQGGLHGLRVTEVHAIFRLPPHLRNYPQPLAYIHWFKPLQVYDNNVKMFHVSCLTRQQLPNTEVIPVHRIIQHCHLIPWFPWGMVHPNWLHGYALADTEHFYLNRHINLKIFEQYMLHE
ncbi:hypothetical protein J3R82DRAFT_2863 [Butyriboletus roseoflavus]|nr:hypothetical protein J3R82DRAFT_2863 [Butyriboletus roseoflavus]